MKKLIKKFKNWLIIKLGGYTSQTLPPVPTTTIMMRPKDYQPIILEASFSDWRRLGPPPDECPVEIKGMMAKQFAENPDFLKNIEIVSTYNNVDMTITYRARLKILPGWSSDGIAIN